MAKFAVGALTDKQPFKVGDIVCQRYGYLREEYFRVVEAHSNGALDVRGKGGRRFGLTARFCFLKYRLK